MNTLKCNHKDLYTLLEALKRAGVRIDEVGNMELQILDPHFKKQGENNQQPQIIFHAKPAGRKGDEIWYDVQYSEKFEKLMGFNINSLKEIN